MTPRPAKSSDAARARYARYRQTDKYREAQRRYRSSDKWKRAQSMYGKEARAVTPERIGARRAVALALQFGMLTRPEHCPNCLRKALTEAHHHLGWELAHWFDVMWLCSRCHKALHWGLPL